MDAAYAFLDYVLEAEPMAKIVNGVHYAGAKPGSAIPGRPKIRQDPAIYPPKEVLDRWELIEDLEKTARRNQ